MAPKNRARAEPPESKVQPGRVGKVQIRVFVEPDMRKRLKGLALELDTSVEALMLQQLEALLRKHAKRGSSRGARVVPVPSAPLTSNDRL